MIPHVDDFRPVHNLESLAQLAEALGTESAADRASLQKWKRMAA